MRSPLEGPNARMGTLAACTVLASSWGQALGVQCQGLPARKAASNIE